MFFVTTQALAQSARTKILCIGYLERRIGRQLVATDFTHTPDEMSERLAAPEGEIMTAARKPCALCLPPSHEAIHRSKYRVGPGAVALLDGLERLARAEPIAPRPLLH